MLATVEGHIGRAFMHILFVHCSVVLLADTPSIGVTRVGLMSECARLPRSCSRVRSALWLRVSRSPVVHAGRDPRLPIPLSMLLSDPCPAVVLVSNGLERRSPRTRGIWSIRRSDLTREPW